MINTRKYVVLVCISIIAISFLFTGCDRFTSPSSPNALPQELNGTFEFVASAYYNQGYGGQIYGYQIVLYQPADYTISFQPDGSWNGHIPDFAFTNGLWECLYPNTIFLRGTVPYNSENPPTVDTVSYQVSSNTSSLRLVRNNLSGSRENSGEFAVKVTTGTYNVGGYLQTANGGLPPVHTLLTAHSATGSTFTASTDEFGFYAFSGVPADSLRVTASFSQYLLDTIIFVPNSCIALNCKMVFSQEPQGTFVYDFLVGSYDLLCDYNREMGYLYTDNSFTTTVYPANSKLTIEPNGRWSIRTSDFSRNRSGFSIIDKSYGDVTFVVDSASDQNWIGNSTSYLTNYGGAINSFDAYVSNSYFSSGFICTKNLHKTLVSGVIQTDNQNAMSFPTSIYYRDQGTWTMLGYSNMFGVYYGEIPVTADAIRAEFNPQYNNQSGLYVPEQTITKYLSLVPGKNSIVNFSFSFSSHNQRFNFIDLSGSNPMNISLQFTGTHRTYYDSSPLNWCTINLHNDTYRVIASKNGYNSAHFFLGTDPTGLTTQVCISRYGYQTSNTQGTVFVRDSTDNINLSSARVDILDGPTTYTDIQGKFTLPMEYSLSTRGIEVSFPGYATSRLNVDPGGNYYVELLTLPD